MKAISHVTLALMLAVNTNSTVAGENGGLGGVDSESMLPYADILQATMNPTCVEWSITGMCFWMTCTIFGCSFSSSVEVEHWNPDLIVEVKSDVEESPLGYTALTGGIFSEIGSEMLNVVGIRNDGLQSSATGGVKAESGGGQTMSNLRFNDVTVVGNPAITEYSLLYGAAFGAIGWCASPAVPLQIYYDSLLDAFEWRVGIFEAWNSISRIPEFLGPYGMDHYGELYPRIGATTHPSPYKAASTLAYRAAHIVKEDAGSHVVLNKLPKFSSTRYSYPTKRMSNSHSRWSNIAPAKSISCQPLASQRQNSFSELREHSEQENYLKGLWNSYRCCYRRGKTKL